MTFLEKHLLFPKRFGITPYFWLVFLVPTIIQLLSLDSWIKWLFVCLLLIFLKAYRDGYTVHKYLTVDIVVQLIIACLFGLFLNNGYLFIFTAWEIGSVPVPKTVYYRYLVSYYVSAAISLITMVIILYPISSTDMVEIPLTVVAAIISPLAAKAMNETYRRTYHLSQQNKRLEAIVRQNERDRIAQDLHDNLGQAFSIITLKAELAKKLASIDLLKAEKELQDIAETSRANLTLVRGIVANLQERTIAKTMLEEEKHLAVAKIRLQTTNEENAVNWPISVQNTLSAVIKEAVTNMIRHSQASLAIISFEENKADYFVRIQDNGQGFLQVKEGSYGLSGMKQRIQAKNGKLEINSTQGTEILVFLPKEQTND